MKKILLAIVLMFSMNGVFAQAHTEIELIRSQYKLEKKAVVAQYLQLSNEDAEKFWPIYNKYEEERVAIGDRRIKLITDYVNEKHKGAVTDADEMVKESTDIQKKEAELRLKYYNQIKTGVSPAVAINFFQIEDQIATAVKTELWKELGK
jgi:hypothetical protein